MLQSLTHGLGTPLTSAVCMNTSSNYPVAFFIYSDRFYSANIIVGHVCLVLNMMSLPVFIQTRLSNSPLQSLLLGSTMTPSVHSLPIFQCNHHCRPCRKDKRILMCIIVLIILILMGLQSLILHIIIVYVYRCSIHLRKRPHIGLMVLIVYVIKLD